MTLSILTGLPARLSRRSFLIAAGAASGAALVPPGVARAAVAAPGDAPPVRDLRLVAAPATAQLLPAGQPATPVWAFNGMGPPARRSGCVRARRCASR